MGTLFVLFTLTVVSHPQDRMLVGTVEVAVVTVSAGKKDVASLKNGDEIGSTTV